MENTEKTFQSLVSESPLLQKSDKQKTETITLAGALARTAQEGKFALVQEDGSSLILDSSLVLSHTVIGSTFGQTIVQVELDAEKAPKEAHEQSRRITPLTQQRTGNAYIGIDWVTPRPRPKVMPQTGPQQITTSPFVDHPVTTPLLDHPATNPVLDNPVTFAYFDHPTTNPYLDHFTSPLLDHPGTNPVADHIIEPAADVMEEVPFSLATEHQLPPDVLQSMEASTAAAPTAKKKGPSGK